MLPLHDKSALIPGASRPIGRAIARKFGQAGATLFLPVFDWPDSVKEMEQEFTDSAIKFHSISLDLRDKDDAIKLAATIQRETGSLDFLINNIERGGMPIVHGSYDNPHNKDQWDLEFDTTLKAKWLVYHYCAPLMKSRPGGAVVNLSSVAAVNGRSGAGGVFFNDGYSAANRAIQSFTEMWARESAPDIRVNELMLGLIKSRHGEETRGWGELSDLEKNDLYDNVLLGRTGAPREVAEAVFFLAVEATYFTGTCLRMDGGFILGSNQVSTMPPGIL